MKKSLISIAVMMSLSAVVSAEVLEGEEPLGNTAVSFQCALTDASSGKVTGIGQMSYFLTPTGELAKNGKVDQYGITIDQTSSAGRLVQVEISDAKVLGNGDSFYLTTETAHMTTSTGDLIDDTWIMTSATTLNEDGAGNEIVYNMTWNFDTVSLKVVSGGYSILGAEESTGVTVQSNGGFICGDLEQKNPENGDSDDQLLNDLDEDLHPPAPEGGAGSFGLFGLIGLLGFGMRRITRK